LVSISAPTLVDRKERGPSRKKWRPLREIGGTGKAIREKEALRKGDRACFCGKQESAEQKGAVGEFLRPFRADLLEGKGKELLPH